MAKSTFLPGFVEERLSTFNAGEKDDYGQLAIDETTLLVPLRLKGIGRITQEKAYEDRSNYVKQQQEIRRIAESEATSDEDGGDQEVSLHRRKISTSTGLTNSTKPSEETDYEDERLQLLKNSETCIDLTSARVYNWEEPLKLIGIRSADSDLKKYYRDLYNKLMPLGNFRKLSTGCVSDAELQKFRIEHSNFEEVIDLVATQLKLSQMIGSAFTLPPILLLGPPGVGKTHFARALADLVGVCMNKIGFDADQTSSLLLGSSKHWGNSTPGYVFNAVCLGAFANPFFFLDEIDKSASHFTRQGGGGSAITSLHSLLEPVSSKAVVDISLDFEFDASQVIWLAAANDPSRIPSTLLSRFRIFQIDSPTGIGALQLAENVALRVHQGLAPSGVKVPSRKISKQLAHLTLREQRQAWEHGFANAVINGRADVQLSDFPASVFLDDPTSKPKPGSLH